MGNGITLEASDGHEFDAWRAAPDDEPRGAVVIIQEIFGVNAHVQRVCEGYAADGYLAIAPALFDRIERGVELDYDEAGTARGRELRTRLGWEDPLRDIDAAVALARDTGNVATIGYCWGGSLSWLTATRLKVDAAVCYYGGQIGDFLDEQARCPVLMHFGERDELIPLETVEGIRAAHPDIPVFMYPAGHGFNCDARASWHAESAELARRRTLNFLAEHVG